MIIKIIYSDSSSVLKVPVLRSHGLPYMATMVPQWTRGQFLESKTLFHSMAIKIEKLTCLEKSNACENSVEFHGLSFVLFRFDFLSGLVFCNALMARVAFRPGVF